MDAKLKRNRLLTNSIDCCLGAVYLSAATIMPLYNFLSYKGKHHIVEPFPYPVTFTGVQMLVTGLFLACCNIILHAFKRQPSWIFGRGFLIKITTLFMPAAIFGANISAMNLGLEKTSVSMHVLFRSSEVIWIVIFAAFLQKERPTWLTMTNCGLFLGGTLLVAVQLFWSTGVSSSSWSALLLNIVSTIVSPLYLALLKWCLGQLNKAGYKLHPTEISGIVITLTALVMLVPAPLIEPPAFPRLLKIDVRLLLVLLAGIVLTCSFKFVMIAMIDRQHIITVGMIGQMKCVPQVLMDMFFFKKYPFTPLMVIGTGINLLAAIMFTLLQFKGWTYRRDRKDLPAATEEDLEADTKALLGDSDRDQGTEEEVTDDQVVALE